MLQLNERLRDIREDSKVNQTEFAQIGGVSLTSQQNYERGSRIPDAEYLSRLHEAGFDAHYILTGERSTVSVPDGFISIPRLAAVGSMGTGTDGGLPHEDVIEQITVSILWLRRNLPAVTSFKNLQLITGHGDSMSDTYEDGAALFVDVGVQEFSADGIYIFNLEGDIFIKRLQKLPKGRVMVISDNRAKYEPFFIERGDQFHVIGKIVGSWKFNNH